MHLLQNRRIHDPQSILTHTDRDVPRGAIGKSSEKRPSNQYEVAPKRRVRKESYRENNYGGHESKRRAV